MNVPLHVLVWFWALLPTLGESGPGWLQRHAMWCLLGVPSLPLLGGGGQLLPTCPFHVMPSWLPRWGGRGYQMLFESLKNTSFFSGGKLQPLPGLVRSTAAKPLFLGSYLLEYLCPFNIAFPLSCYWRKVSSQHMSDCVEFCTQAFDVISCCSWYPSFKRSHGELLITSLYCLFSLMRQRLNSFSDHLKPC